MARNHIEWYVELSGTYVFHVPLLAYYAFMVLISLGHPNHQKQ